MMQRMIISVILFCVTTNQVAMGSVVDEIRELRDKQQTASLQEYYQYEDNISELKREAGAVPQQQNSSSLWVFVRDIGHALPFIVWQLLSLVLLFFFIIKKTCSWLLTLALCGSLAVVGVQQYERSQQWLIIPKDGVEMRLGPGDSYPTAGKLGMLDEVRVIDQRDGWYQVVYNGTTGWLPQGVVNDTH